MLLSHTTNWWFAAPCLLAGFKTREATVYCMLPSVNPVINCWSYAANCESYATQCKSCATYCEPVVTNCAWYVTHCKSVDINLWSHVTDCKSCIANPNSICCVLSNHVLLMLNTILAMSLSLLPGYHLPLWCFSDSLIWCSIAACTPKSVSWMKRSFTNT